MLQRWGQYGVGFWTPSWLAVLAGPFSRMYLGITYTVVATAVTLWNQAFRRAE